MADRHLLPLLVGALAALLAACAPAGVLEHEKMAPAEPASAGSEWVEHLERDLVPFWTRAAALGDPVGRFPTFRCHDGRAWDPSAPCAELAEAPPWIRESLGRDYTRMRSRQTYFYGAAFHLLGDPRLLELARAGAARIAAEVEPDGSIASWREGGHAGPAAGERTSQDLAYAQLGLAMTWYLTREPALLDRLVAIERHLFEAYWRPEWGMLGWTGAGPEAERQELVAQLDQVNAYLLLLAPLLPEPHRSRWSDHLRTLAQVMVERYWDEASGMFLGRLDAPEERGPGGRHFDFGHTGKALWMIERIGVTTGDEALAAWARPRAARLLARAFDAGTGCWTSAPQADGTLDRGLTWWTFAELDQAAATLALGDPAARRYLAPAAACWHTRLVDRAAGGVWAWADPVDPARHAGKAHLWKNGYHEGEHALVLAILGAAAAGAPARLHFALPTGSGDEALRPYFFDGKVASRRRLGQVPGLPGHRVERVEFVALR